MRLLNTRSLALEFFTGGDIPPYAILSHTWEAGEVSLQELHGNLYDASSQGWIKIQRSAQLAAMQELGYIWIDTCCIDKSSSAELSEAINSMFQWYERAAVCYVYLCDVAAGQDPIDFAASGGQGSSRWFSRGWTLQELIAPRHVQFYNRDWQSMGTRAALGPAIRAVTGIPMDILSFSPATTGTASVSHLLELTSVAEKMSWAARRVTTREEDTAYSLLGLFDINMPLLYGEGRAKAFRRLQEEIIRATDDESIFVWRLDEPPAAGANPFCGLLADGPERFGLFTDLVPRRSRYLATRSSTRSARSASRLGVQIDLPLAQFPCDASGTLFLALLGCDMRREGAEAMFTPALVLQRAAHEDETRFVRVRADLVPLCMMNRVVAPHRLTRLIADLQRRQMPDDGVHGEDYYVGNIAFKTARPVSVFVPSTVDGAPSLTPNGILLFPELQDAERGGGGGGGGSLGRASLVRVVSRSPTWQIFSDKIDCYEVNFRVNPVPPVGAMTGPVVCGALELLLDRDTPLSSLGVVGPRTTRVCLVAGLEPPPPNPFGTPGLYAVPWYAFEEPARVEAGDLEGAKDPTTRITELARPFGVRAEFGFIP
ncbi:ankyrin repeat-containing protein [Cordyceps javanica]|uniref:Ankyrin repeat-containing protein n=1 Tax=Cordyceps javanica TaxID=43265 RepID=A0A545UM57_9HYPO|nr:ankyrin repeat-containing protein [Cordyceps javanica]